MALVELVITLFKIALQSGVYALVLALLIHVSNSAKSKHFKKFLTKNFLLTGIKMYPIIFAALFIVACFLWSARGIGDTAKLNVANGTSIYLSDGFFLYFERGNEQRLIGSFAINDGKIFAEDRFTTSDERESADNYLIYDCHSSELLEFDSKSDYDNYAGENNFPLTTQFREFPEHYRSYWGGWRRWVLP
jgi:hypothetical protein